MCGAKRKRAHADAVVPPRAASADGKACHRGEAEAAHDPDPVRNAGKHVDLWGGADPGRTNIGEAVVDMDGNVVHQAEVRSRNRDTPRLMRKRAAHRRANGTVTDSSVRQRILPGCGDSFRAKWFRRHGSALVKAQTERTCRLDGRPLPGTAGCGSGTGAKPQGLCGVLPAQDRRRRVSRLSTAPPKRRCNDLARHLPGTVFRHRYHRRLKSGQQRRGTALRAVGTDRTFSAKQCGIVPAADWSICKLLRR